MGFLPPGTGELEALLDDMAMTAFYLAGTNGKFVAACGGVVQMVLTFPQIPAGVPHGSFGCGRYFLMRLQAPEHLFGLIV